MTIYEMTSSLPPHNFSPPNSQNSSRSFDKVNIAVLDSLCPR